MAAAVSRIDQIDPDDCRQRALDFGVTAMCTRYTEIYARVARGDHAVVAMLDRAG